MAKKRIQSSKGKRQTKNTKKTADLLQKIAELEGALHAIRNGEVDAVVVRNSGGDQVFTLQGAEHPYRLLVEAMDEGAATLSDDGIVLYCNKSFAAIFGAPLEKFTGLPLRNFVSGEDSENLDALLKTAQKHTARGEIHLALENGRPRTVRLTLSPHHECGVNAIYAVATELTELIETNDALRVTEASLRQLSGRLLQMQDEERRRIARDLHDTTGQKIAVLSIAMDRLTRLADLRNPELKETLKDSRDVVRDISSEIRTLSYLLHPPLLDECGLASAVRWYAEGFEKRSGIQLHVHIPPDLVRLPIEAETALFRVVQESLTNVHRYSGSASAKIQISVVAGQVQLEVIDYGKGIKSGAPAVFLKDAAPLGVGIPGMRERLHQLGGQLEVNFGTNGTHVHATLPLKNLEMHAEPSLSNGNPSGDHPAAKNGHNGGISSEHRTRIFIADDHEIMRRGLRGLIESQDDWAVCGEAVEGQEAVSRVKELSPDIVIMDINMPGLSGIEAARQIRQRNSSTRILFFTVHDSDQMMREITKVGAQGYVAKSRAGQDLVEAVRSIMDGGTFFPDIPAVARQAV